MKNLLIAFLFLVTKAYSCECKYQFSEFTPYNLLEYNNIFSGKAIRIDTIQGNFTVLKVQMLVSKFYWGARKDTMIVTTYGNGGMCGFYFELDKEYLLYTYKWGPQPTYVSMCSPSHPLSTSIEKNSFQEAGYGLNDSIKTSINHVTKYYSIKYLEEYDRKATKNEILLLDSISKIENGTFIFQFTNGKIAAKLNFINGFISDTAKFYFANGKLKSIGLVKENKKEGKWDEYDLLYYGKWYLRERGNYTASERKGVWERKLITGDKKKFKEYYSGLRPEKVNYDD